MQAQARHRVDVDIVGPGPGNRAVERDIERIGAEARDGRADRRADLTQDRQRENDDNGNDSRRQRPVQIAGNVDEAYGDRLVKLLHPLGKADIAGKLRVAMREDREHNQRQGTQHPEQHGKRDTA